MNHFANVIFSFLIFAAGSNAFATGISPGNILGRYDVNASAFFKKVRIDFKVINEKEFEIFQYDRDGKPEETCNGTYNIVQNKSLRMGVATITTVLKGIFNCPSNRTKMIDFDLDFQNKSVEDIVTGTTVIITTSMAPMKIKANVKKIGN